MIKIQGDNPFEFQGDNVGVTSGIWFQKSVSGILSQFPNHGKYADDAHHDLQSYKWT